MNRALALLLIAGCTPDTGIKVYNTEPGVSITSPAGGESFPEATVISFLALVQDNEDDPGDLFLSWASDLDGTLDQSFGASVDGFATFSTANLSVGAHTITLSATDTSGSRASDTVLITVEDVEDIPTLTIARPTGTDYGVEDVPFEFRAKLSDEQDPPTALLMVVESDLEGELCRATPYADGLAACSAALGVGRHTLTFIAYDSAANSAEATATFTVISTLEVDDDGDGYSESLGDCDDGDADIYPGAPEQLDGLDQDCDNLTDEGTAGYDDDEDGLSELDGDCNDALATVYPGATEYCDGVDQDCDFTTDEGTSCYDDDGDGYTEEGGDCNDALSTTFPGAAEVCDSADQDCDGTTDEGTTCYDDDGDGYTELGGDCNDALSIVFPGATETCDGVDQDCDGKIDEGTSCYDDDGDGVTEAAGDCNDADATISPKATESCDGVDDDCDGSTDEANATGCTVYYTDVDADSYGSASVSACLCASTTTYSTTNDDDCYDANAKANPTQTGYFSVDRGDGSYDYNCDSSQTKQSTTKLVCSYDVTKGGCYASTSGWDGKVPACGASGSWATDCSLDFSTLSCVGDSASKTMSCN